MITLQKYRFLILIIFPKYLRLSQIQIFAGLSKNHSPQLSTQKQMLEHYFHQSYQFRTKRRNIRQFKIHNSKSKLADQQQKFICMSNGNAIEIYKISSQSVDFYMRKQFFCNIVKIQIIPSLHHDSDYIFILDDLGRFSFWRPGQGQRQTCNVIQKQDTNKRYYRQQLSPEEEEEFSGSAFRFDVKDTVGYIFYTVQNKLTLLSVSVKSKQGLRIQNTRTYEIPYTRFRFVNCLQLPAAKNSQFVVGIIQQLQEKTILKIHVLNPQISSILIDEESLSFKIEKTNLLSFQSGENDEIIVLTYDQISLHRYKQSQYLCNYRTRGNYGSVCYISGNSHKSLPQATYIHLGFNMTVFTKSRLHNYGSLRLQGKNLLQNRGITESKYLGHVGTGEIMLGFVTSFGEVYFVTLSDNSWRLVRRIQSLESIFSIQQLRRQQNDSSMIVVHSSVQSSSEIAHVQITSPTILDQQQLIQSKVIETVDLAENGQSLVISAQGQSSLLSWSEKDNRWVEHFGFNNMKEQVLACTGIHVVMTSGIYKYEVNSSNQLAMTQLVKQDNVLSAVSNGQYIGYYTSEGNYKFYQFQSNSVTRVRKNCVEEYIWHMIKDKNILISAAYNEPGELRVLPIQKVAKKIQLQTKQLVSSINSITYSTNKKDQKMVDQNSEDNVMTDLIIGFHNGDLEVYSLNKDQTVAKFSLGAEMVNVTSYRTSHVIVYTGNKQFILSRNVSSESLNIKQLQRSILCNSSPEYKLYEVQFSDNFQRITKILYLQKFDKFLVMLHPSTLTTDKVLNSSLIQLRSLKLNKKLSDHQLTLQLKSSISLKPIFKTQKGETIPFAHAYDNQSVYIAIPQNIFKYSIRTKELVRKQFHLLKEILGIQSVESGILVTGVDVMESGSVILFDFNDLNIKGTYNLGTSKPTCIKSFKTSPNYTNRFLIRHQSYISILQVQSTHLITLLKTINTKTEGLSMDINQKFNKLLLTDPYRYLSVWDYDMEVASKDLIPVSKYFGPFIINDCCWLDGAVVAGDRGGNLSILQFNLSNKHDLHKMNMTKVAEIYIGEEIFTLRKIQSEHNETQGSQKSNKNEKNEQTEGKVSGVYYGTASGSIGIIKTISQQQFKLLKQIQLDTIKYIDLKQHFSYEQWRKRIPKDDKLIDSTLIRYYLEEFKHKVKITQEDFYNEVNQLYTSMIGGIKNIKSNRGIN